jgi:hypothetical protein
MSVPLKPHTFRIFLQEARIVANQVIQGYDPLEPGQSVRGCAQQLSPSASYDAFAREVNNGFAFYLDPTDINKSVTQVGGTIEYNGDLYAIEKVQTNEQGIATDHIAVYAVQVRH